MTSIELLFNKLWEEHKDKLTWNIILEEAKEMHKQEMKEMYLKGIENYDPTFKRKDDTLKDYHIVDTNKMVEISDEEIEIKSNEFFQMNDSDIEMKKKAMWKLGAKWYREQLKQKL